MLTPEDTLLNKNLSDKHGKRSVSYGQGDPEAPTTAQNTVIILGFPPASRYEKYCHSSVFS